MNMTHMNTRQEKSFVFTGWHMAGVLVLFFGTIISVNFYMAYNAFTSWSGLVADDTYVASQQFNGKVAAAKALAATGVIGKLTVSASEVRFEIFHPKDGPVAADSLILKFKRPVGDHQDFELDLAPISSGVFVAAHDFSPGHWIVEAEAMRDGKQILHHTERIAVIRGQE